MRRQYNRLFLISTDHAVKVGWLPFSAALKHNKIGVRGEKP